MRRYHISGFCVWVAILIIIAAISAYCTIGCIDKADKADYDALYRAAKEKAK